VNNNVVSGVGVVLSTSEGTITSPASASDVNGLAVGSLRTIHSGAKTVTAKLGAAALLVTQTASITFIGDAAHVSAGNSTLLATPTSGVLANGTTASSIVVTVQGVNGNPVPGVSVTLSTSGATATNPGAVTDASGVATGSLTATIAGSKTVSATAGGVAITAQATVVFIGDSSHLSAALSSVTVAPAAGVVANGTTSSAISIVVRDVNGNAVSGQTVTLAIAGATPKQPTVVTDATGTTSGSVTSTSAGTKTIIAGVAGTTISQQPTVAFIGDANHLSASLSTITASPTTGVVANGSTTSTLTVTVRDINTNPVPNVQVALAASSATVTNPSAVSNAAGVATGAIAATLAGTKTVAATIGTGASAITVTPSATVTLSGADSTATNPSEVTNAAGVTTGTLTSIHSGTKAVTVTTGNVTLTAAPTVAFIGDAAHLSATMSSAVATPTTGTVANGTAKAQVAVTVRDINGNAVSGQTVKLAAPNATVTNPAATTDVNGLATGFVAATIAGSKTVRLTAGAITLTQTVQVGFMGDATRLSATLSTVVGQTATSIANNVAQAAVVVTARDVNGNVCSGVTAAISSSEGTVTQPGAVTALGGTTMGTVSSLLAGTKTLQATLTFGAVMVAITATGTTPFVGDPHNISRSLSTLSVSPTTNAVANGTTGARVTVTVYDNNNNLVPNAAVTLSTPSAGATVTAATTTNASGVSTGYLNTLKSGKYPVGATAGSGSSVVAITQPSAVTNAAGTVTGSITTLKSGTHTLTATVGSAGAGSLVTTWVAAPATQLVFTVQPAVQVAAEDANGNIDTTYVSTISLTITTGTGPATATLAGGTAKAATAGVASFAALQVDTGGTGYTLTATPANSTSLTTATSSAFSITCAGCRAPPSRLSWNGPSNSFWPALKIARGAELTAPREVRVGLLPPVGPVSLAQLDFALPDESPSAPAQLSPPAFVEPIPDVRSGHARLTLRRLPDPHSVTNARTVPLFGDERGTSGDEDDLLYLAATDEQGHSKLHRFDGTSFTQVAETNPLGDDNPTVLSIRDGRVLFRAVAADQTEQLFLLDGDQTTRVLDHSESLQAAPSAARIDYGSADWITRTDRSGMTQLLRKEGAGWSRLPDVVPGSHPKAPLRFRAALWFSLEDSRGAHLWRLCDASESCQP